MLAQSTHVKRLAFALFACYKNTVFEGFAERLRQARRASGLRQDDLAAKAGLSRGFVSQLERGERQPGAAGLSAIAAVLGVRSEWLATGAEPREGATWHDAANTLAGRVINRLKDDPQAANPETREEYAALQRALAHATQSGDRPVSREALSEGLYPSQGSDVARLRRMVRAHTAVASEHLAPSGDRYQAGDLELVGRVVLAVEGPEASAVLFAWQRVVQRLQRCAADRMRLAELEHRDERAELARAEAELGRAEAGLEWPDPSPATAPEPTPGTPQPRPRAQPARAAKKATKRAKR